MSFVFRYGSGIGIDLIENDKERVVAFVQIIVVNAIQLDAEALSQFGTI